MTEVAALARALLLAVMVTMASPGEAGAQSAKGSRGAPGAGDVKPGPEGLLSRFSVATESGPISIQADQMEFDYRTRVLSYRGSVRVTQNDVTLESDTLRVELDPEGVEPLEKIIAEGAVRIAKGERQRASGGHAVFDQRARTVTLSDRATLRDGPNEVAGERVIVYLDEERSVVEGGDERVRAVLFPPKAGEKDADREE
jgi:lipopolysaccharide export system protein LptA